MSLTYQQLFDQLMREFTPRIRGKLERFKAVVVEVGSGANAGMVRVRREGEEGDPGRKWAPVLGEVPALDATVWAIGDFAGELVITGGTSGGGISGIAVEEDGVEEGASIQRLNFSTGLDVAVTGGEATISAPGGGVTDHGALTGLADDDHPQYKLHSEEELAEDSVTGATLLSNALYPTGISMVRVLATNTGWPAASTAYTIQTHKTSNTRGFQLAVGAAADTYHLRRWDQGTAAWGSWIDLLGGSALQAHLDDTTDAHDASAISYAGGTGMSATDAEAAIDELATEKANAADLTAHLNDTTDAHDASAISYLGSANLSSTQVEAALDELDSEKLAIGTGTQNATTFRRGDGTWAVPAGSGVAEYFFHAERITSIQNMAAAGLWDTVIFNSQIEDVGAWYDPATGIATAPAAGLYEIIAGIKWSTPASTETANIGISKNAASPPVPNLHLVRFAAATEITSQITYRMRLAASDTVRIMVNVSLGAINVDFSPATHFIMRYLGAYT